MMALGFASGATLLGSGCGSSSTTNNGTDSGPKPGSDTGVVDTGPGMDTGPVDSGADTTVPPDTSTGDTGVGQDSAPPPDSGADTNPADTNPACTPPPAPTFTPMGGTTATPPGSVTVTIAEAWPPGETGTVYYTVDGTQPGPNNPSSKVYINPITFSGTSTTTIIAVGDVMAPGTCLGTPANATYTITAPAPGTLADPMLSPMSQSSTNDFTVSASDSPGATICFTLDGTMPTCNATGMCTGTSQTYNAANQIIINGSNQVSGMVTVNALACETGDTTSGITTQMYTLQTAPPTMVSPAPGAVLFTTTGVSILGNGSVGPACTPINPAAGCFVTAPTISTATNPSAAPSITQIRYTFAPNAPPTCTVGTSVNLQGMNANVIPLTNTVTVQAIACKTGYLPSAVVNFTYTFTLNAPTFPTAGNNGAAGTYDDNPTTAINAAAGAPAGGGFYFTSDGTTDCNFAAGPPATCGAGATGKDPNQGAPDLWICTTVDGTNPGCGPVVAGAGTCMTPADQTVAASGDAITGPPGGTANKRPFKAPAIGKTGVSIKAIACSDLFTASAVASATYTLQLDSPALWTGGLGASSGPGCTGAPTNTCILPNTVGAAGASNAVAGSKTVATPAIASFAIPSSQAGIFTSNVQQDVGVNPTNTTPQTYDYACVDSTGTAACGPVNAACAAGNVLTTCCTTGAQINDPAGGQNAAGGFLSAKGAPVGPANTIQPMQTWTVQGCSATGTFANSLVTTVKFTGPGVAAQPLVAPITNGPFSQILGSCGNAACTLEGNGLGGVTITNPDINATAANMQFCFTNNAVTPVCANGGLVCTTGNLATVSSAGYSSVNINGGMGVGIGFNQTCTPTGPASTFTCNGGSGGTGGLVLTSGGSGYTTPPTVTIAAPGGGAGQVVNGGWETVFVNPGAGCTSAPTVVFGGSGTGAAATATIAGGAVTAITLTAPGSGYTAAVPTTVTFPAGSGGCTTTPVANNAAISGQATATAVLSPSAVASVAITNGGTGFSNGLIPVFSATNAPGCPGAGAPNCVLATGTANVTAGAISAVTLTNAGAGYVTPPTVSFTGPIVDVVVTSPGTNCTALNDAVTIRFNGANAGPAGAGSQALAAATVNASNQVTKITLTNAGFGYPSLPPNAVTVTFGGCNATATAVGAATSGSGAVITTTLTPSAVTGFANIVAGSGYLAAPSVTLSGGGGTGATGTAFISNSILLLNQQNEPTTITAVACSTAESQSTAAAQKLDFQLAPPDITSVSNPASATGNLDTGGPIGAGQNVILSTPSNFTGEFIEANVGAMPTNCAGANGGTKLILNALNGILGGCSGAGQPACNSIVLTVGGAAAPLTKANLPAPGTPLVLNTIACPQGGPPTQLDSTPRVSSLTITAATPLISSSAAVDVAGPTSGPVSLTYENNIVVTITSATSNVEATNICYRTDGVTPTCGVAPMSAGTCDGASNILQIPLAAPNGAQLAISYSGTGTPGSNLVAVACASASGGGTPLAQSGSASANYTLNITPVDLVQVSAAGTCPLLLEVGLDCAAVGSIVGSLDTAGNPTCSQTTLNNAVSAPGAGAGATGQGPTGETAVSNGTGLLAGQSVPKFGATVCFSTDGTPPATNCYQGASVPNDVSCFVSNNTGKQDAAGAAGPVANGQTIAQQIENACPANTTCPAPNAQTPGGVFVLGARGQILQTIIGPSGAPPGGVDVDPTKVLTQTCLNVAAVGNPVTSVAVGMNPSTTPFTETPTPYNFTINVDGDLSQFSSQIGTAPFVGRANDAVLMIANGAPRAGGTAAEIVSNVVPVCGVTALPGGTSANCTTDGAYMAYDATNVYLGVGDQTAGGGTGGSWNGAGPAGGVLMDGGTYVVIYLGDGEDDGSVQGPGAYNPSALPTLPAEFKYAIIWQSSMGGAAASVFVEQYSGTSCSTPPCPASWAVDAAIPVTVGFQSGARVEFSVTRASLGNPPNITMTGAVITNQGGTGGAHIWETFPISRNAPGGNFSDFVDLSTTSCLGPAQQLHLY
jgi:hypothetical protein